MIFAGNVAEETCKGNAKNFYYYNSSFHSQKRFFKDCIIPEATFTSTKAVVFFSRRFSQEKESTIVMAFRLCVSRPPEVTKIVLPKIQKTPNCTCWPKELNQKGFPRNIQYRTTPKGPPFRFFRHCATFFQNFLCTKGSPLHFFWSFATEWMLKNPKGSSFVFSALRLFSIFFHKMFQIHQYFDTLKSFCYF